MLSVAGSHGEALRRGGTPQLLPSTRHSQHPQLWAMFMVVGARGTVGGVRRDHVTAQGDKGVRSQSLGQWRARSSPPSQNGTLLF